MIIQRQLKGPATTLLRKYPILAITGPRQSGKTTFCKMLCPDYQYLNMELGENQDHARSDPHGFLQTYRGGVILDEAQNVPELFPYLQFYTDERNEPGEYILTGSQHFLLLEKITQSLAGRVALFSLLPFSIEELRNEEWEKRTWEDYLWTGFYPRIYQADISPADFYPDYLQTYVERDVRQIVNVTSLTLFKNFISICAGRVGQLLNLTQIGNDIGVDAKTVNRWLSILEASFIIYRLHPYYKNFNKRIVKTPKLYFYDTGLASYLLGIRSASDIELHFAKGALFENFVINELLKNQLNAHQKPQFFFWQENNGSAIDLIIERGISKYLVEIKSGKTINNSFFKNLMSFEKWTNDPVKAWLVYGGDKTQERTGSKVLTWNTLANMS